MQSGTSISVFQGRSAVYRSTRIPRPAYPVYDIANATGSQHVGVDAEPNLNLTSVRSVLPRRSRGPKTLRIDTGGSSPDLRFLGFKRNHSS